MRTLRRSQSAYRSWLWLALVCVLLSAPCLGQDEAAETPPPATEPGAEAAPETEEPPEAPPTPPAPTPSDTEDETEEPTDGGEAPAEPSPEPDEEESGEPEIEGEEAGPSEARPEGEEEPDEEAEVLEPTAAPEEADEEVPGEEEPTLAEEAAAQPAAAPRRRRVPLAPPPRVVSRKVEKQRDESVRQSLEIVAAPEAKRVSEGERLAALADLVRQARMQLAALRTEHAQFETEREELEQRGAEIAGQQARVPPLVSEGKLPLMYAEAARDEAEETVAAMNELFDRALARRAELVAARTRYRSELAEARSSARALQGDELRKAWPAALGVLQDRLDITSDVVTLLDQIITKTVEVSEAGAQLSLDLNRAIRLSLPRRLLARTAAPLSSESFDQIKDEVAALGESAAQTFRDARSAVGRVNPWIAAILTLLLVALAVALWWEIARLPDHLVPTPDGDGDPQRSSLRRALRLLVPAARALVLTALWATLTRAWGLPDGWWLAGLYLLGAWTGYFVFNFVLRELFAPRHAEFRLVNLRQEAAQNLCRLLRALARYTVVVLPPIGLLSGLEQPPGESIRALQVICGAGLLLVGACIIRQAGGLGSVLPRPETPQKTALQQAGEILLPLGAVGVLGGVIAAAGGYSNLSSYLSRSLSLELLVLMPAVFVYNLALSPVDDDSRWRLYGRWVLWAVVILAQIPIWRLHTFHATYAFDLLKRSIITVEGAEVTGLTVTKGLVFILIAYLIARFVRSHLQTWSYLKQRFQTGVAYAMSNLAFYLILAAGIVWGILASGFQLSVLTVFAGMAGIGLGFGLQNIVSNFFSGLILLLERPVAVGDFVDVSGLQGHITAINLRSTTIRTRDNNVVLVPNSDLAASIVTNLTISDPKVRVTINIGVSYNSDLALVRDILRRAAHENENVLEDPEPRIYLMDFGSSSVDFVLYAWVKDAETGIFTGPELRLQIWDAFKEQNVEIPFPQTDLHIRSSDVALPNPGEKPHNTEPGAS